MRDHYIWIHHLQIQKPFEAVDLILTTELLPLLPLKLLYHIPF